MNNDLISRQAAIEALLQELVYKSDTCDEGLNRYDVESILKSLPSAEADEDKVREWCYKRGLTILDNLLFHEMRRRWSSTQPDVPDRDVGEWKRGDEMPEYPRVPYKPYRHYCSKCCAQALKDCVGEEVFSDFCPNCGAMMFDKDTNVRSKGENDGMDSRSE